MKKITLVVFLFFATNFYAQVHVHSFPTGIDYYDSPAIVGNTDIELRLDYLLNTFLPDKEANVPSYFGDLNTYYSRRVLSHIQLYEYYSGLGDTSKMTLHADYLSDYLEELLDEQCVSGYTLHLDSSFCSSAHGGFPSPSNTGTDDNPRTTAIAVQALVGAQKFYEATNLQPPVSTCELHERTLLAKDALVSYQYFNEHFTNLASYGFLGAIALRDYYGDVESYDFLEIKGNILLNGLHPMKSTANTPGWNLSWDEEQQADGSWQVYGYDGSPNLFPSNTCSQWHDSEAIYHAIMIEGLSELYRSLKNGSLKNLTKEKLIESINHIIDYNGATAGTLGDEALDAIHGNYENSRLNNSGLISNYHRETDNDCITDEYINSDGDVIKPTIETQGYGYIVALMKAVKSLDGDIPSNELEVIENILHGLAHKIFFGSTYKKSRGDTQLVDISYYLNRNNFFNNTNVSSTSNEELVMSFDDTKIHRIQKNTPDRALFKYETFYPGTQLTEKMVSGDFDGDGEDEILIAFEQGLIYRYDQDANGNFVVKDASAFYQGTQLVLNMVVGDFDDNGKDEAIIAFDEGLIYRYHENANGNFVVKDASAFYQGSQSVQDMVVGDFDGNGKDEAIIAFDQGLIYRYYENASGNFVDKNGAAFYQGTQLVQHMTVGDFEGNGSDEAIIAFNQGLIYRYHENSSGNFVDKNGAAFYQGTQLVQHMAVGDFDADGSDEAIIAFDEGLIYRYHENSSGNFVDKNGAAFYQGLQLTEGIVTGDFDGDGNDEAVIAFDEGLIYRYRENSSGNFETGCTAFYNESPKVRHMVARRKNNSSRSSNDISSHNIQFEAVEPKNESFTIHSNDQKFIINSLYSNNSTIEIFDIYGRRLLVKEFNETISISKESLTSGLNIFILTNENNRKITKVIN